MLSQKPYFVLQNDFSAMISSEMYDDFYLPILQKECEYIPRTIYHLDGPGAVRHLDSILTIKELDGVQWINGAGAPGLDLLNLSFIEKGCRMTAFFLSVIKSSKENAYFCHSYCA